MGQAMQGATFHIEHVVPRSKGGASDEGNLALACPSCNLHKGDRTHAVDPRASREVALFHPRQDRWCEHFTPRGPRIEGLTARGRATVELLQFNSERRLLIRQIEGQLGLGPPE